MPSCWLLVVSGALAPYHWAPLSLESEGEDGQWERGFPTFSRPTLRVLRDSREGESCVQHRRCATER